MATDEFAAYPVRRESWTLAGERFDLIWPADMDALLDDPRTRERFAREEYMPYWAVPWPSAILLAEYVLTRHRGCGGRAIELGCGVGLVSVAAARAGWSVTATDWDADALKFAAENARANGVSLAGTSVLNWYESYGGPPFELILASDLLYERRNVGPLARWIRAALADGGTALVSDSNRSSADGFAAAAGEAGLSVEKLAREITPPYGLLLRGTIYRLRKPVIP
ncbi:MAG: class I SAM-dependent methyltransferase [Phycisphaerae bacterium]